MPVCLLDTGAACQFDSSATAAWVQAIGSLGAIAFAWWASSRDGRVRRRQEAEQRLAWLKYADVTLGNALAAISKISSEHQAGATVFRLEELDAAAAELRLIRPSDLSEKESVDQLQKMQRALAGTRAIILQPVHMQTPAHQPALDGFESEAIEARRALSQILEKAGGA